MTEASRCGGKIKFIMPDNWTQEQTDKLADNVLEQVAPKITKLAKPKKETEGKTMKSIESFVDAILISLSPEEIRSLIEELTYEIDHQKEKVNTYITVSDGKKT